MRLVGLTDIRITWALRCLLLGSLLIYLGCNTKDSQNKSTDRKGTESSGGGGGTIGSSNQQIEDFLNKIIDQVIKEEYIFEYLFFKPIMDLNDAISAKQSKECTDECFNLQKKVPLKQVRIFDYLKKDSNKAYIQVMEKLIGNSLYFEPLIFEMDNENYSEKNQHNGLDIDVDSLGEGFSGFKIDYVGELNGDEKSFYSIFKNTVDHSRLSSSKIPKKVIDWLVLLKNQESGIVFMNCASLHGLSEEHKLASFKIYKSLPESKLFPHGQLCFDTKKLANTLSENNLEIQLLALFTHEVVHFLEGNEEQAKIIQTKTYNFFYEAEAGFLRKINLHHIFSTIYDLLLEVGECNFNPNFISMINRINALNNLFYGTRLRVSDIMELDDQNSIFRKIVSVDGKMINFLSALSMLPEKGSAEDKCLGNDMISLDPNSKHRLDQLINVVSEILSMTKRVD